MSSAFIDDATGMHQGRVPDNGVSSNLPDQLLDLLPAAVYVCAPDGTILRFNRRAAELWGREPLLADPRDRFCGAYRLYRPDGDLLPHDKCPMADILHDGNPVIDQEVVIERPDGSRGVALVNIRPSRTLPVTSLVRSIASMTSPSASTSTRNTRSHGVGWKN